MGSLLLYFADEQAPALRLAATLWNTTKAIRDGAMRLDDVPTCAGFHPLCDWCAVNATCGL